MSWNSPRVRDVPLAVDVGQSRRDVSGEIQHLRLLQAHLSCFQQIVNARRHEPAYNRFSGAEASNEVVSTIKRWLIPLQSSYENEQSILTIFVWSIEILAQEQSATGD